MSAELEAARQALRDLVKMPDSDRGKGAVHADVMAHAAVAQAAALERIAAWLENVQLADLTGAEGDDEIVPGEGWALNEPGESPPPTREERERAEAESYWQGVEVGDKVRVDWKDGVSSTIAKSAPDQPLHPQVARVRRS